jgi:hypothetical protein
MREEEEEGEMKFDSSSKQLLVVILAAAALLGLVGILWRRDVARLQEELDGARRALVTQPREPAAEPPAPPREEKTESVPPPEPEYRPPPTGSPEVATFVNRDGKKRMTGRITSTIPRVDNKTDIAALASVLKDNEDRDAIRHEAANILRRSGYEQLTDDVIGILDSPEESERFRSFCVQHLSLNLKKAGPDERAKIMARLRRALGDPDIGVRREALLALVRADDAKGKEVAEKWLVQEGADKVRDLAIRCVRELGLREHIPVIRGFLRDENEVVHIAAIVTLGQWGDEKSRPAFEEAATSQSSRLQRAGRLALKRLDEGAGKGGKF